MKTCRCSKAAVTAIGLALAAESALAQVRPDAAPDVLRPTSLMTAPADGPAGLIVTRTSTLRAPASEVFAPTATMPVSYSTQFLGSTLQLDMPRYDSSGTYVRPKFYVGRQSDSMKNLVNATGLSAERCMLPMVRARTKMSGDGEFSGTFWMYARCTLK